MSSAGDDAPMTGTGLRWPTTAPRSGPVSLRAFHEADVVMVEELATDPYVPLIGSLPAHADTVAALAWIERQHARLAEDIGFSFCIADEQDRPLGFAGLWTRGSPGGRVTVGYAVRPSARGSGVATRALKALTALHCPACTASSCTSNRTTSPPDEPPSAPATCTRECCASTRRLAIGDATCACTPLFVGTGLRSRKVRTRALSLALTANARSTVYRSAGPLAASPTCSSSREACIMLG